jgi:LPXTG-motif cell wall-anchored protein
MSTGAIIGIAVAALVLLGGAAFWFMRRRTVGERE